MKNKIEINHEDFIDANLALIHTFVFEANASIEKERKIKNLLLAKEAINKTLGLMNFGQP